MGGGTATGVLEELHEELIAIANVGVESSVLEYVETAEQFNRLDILRGFHLITRYDHDLVPVTSFGDGLLLSHYPVINATVNDEPATKSYIRHGKEGVHARSDDEHSIDVGEERDYKISQSAIFPFSRIF